MLEIPSTQNELKRDVEDAVKRNQKTNGYIGWSFHGGKETSE